MENYRILIVEDEVIIAEDLKDALSAMGYEVCGICYDSESALDQLYRLRPDMVLLDINIRGTKDGIAVARIIKDSYHIPFIFLSSLSDRHTLERARVTRPRGYLVKPFRDQDLMTTIEMAIYNHSMDLKQKQADKSHIDQFANSPLSDREYEIFLDIIDGLNNGQIAEKHFISINTVKTHVKRLFSKLDVHDRLGAVTKVMS